MPDPHERPTMTVEEAGTMLGLSRAAAYRAAARGDLPTMRVGRRLMVLVAPLRRRLGLDGDTG